MLSNNYGWDSNSLSSTTSTENYQNSTSNYENNLISCTNCETVFLSGYHNIGGSTVDRDSKYAHLSSTNALYYVKMSASGTVSISSTINAGHARHVIALSAVPIN